MAIRLGGGNHENPPSTTSTPRAIPTITSGNNSIKNFTRYIGYDNAAEFEKKLIELYLNTKKDGLFLDKPIPNPQPPEVNKVTPYIQNSSEFNVQTIKSIISQFVSVRLIDTGKIGKGKSIDDIANAMNTILEDIKATAPSANAVKNVFINLLCWCIRYNTYKITNILYIGDIGKNEVYWLYFMSIMECSVVYVNYTNETGYLKADSASKYSELIKGSILAPLNLELGKINIAALQQAEKMNAIVNAPSPVMLKYLTTDEDSLIKNIISDTEVRKARLMCTETTIPLYFIAYIGYDDEAIYKNLLFSIKEELTEKGRQLIFLQSIEKASYEEAGEFYSIQKTNDSAMVSSFTSKISISNDNIGRTLLAQKAFVEAVNSINSPNIHNTALQLSVWLKKFTKTLDFSKPDLPIILFYGNITALEFAFLNMMSKTGFDVVYFSPDKSVMSVINAANAKDLQIMEHSQSISGMPFPDTMVKTKLATTAYNAERTLDNVLYNDNTMFRDYQFKMSRNQTLKTTYEELSIMWHQEAKYRTGFDSRNNYVVVPNLFAKINGVKNGDVQAYYKEISFKLSPKSVYFRNVPFFKPSQSNDYYSQYYNGLKINTEQLKKSRYNKFDYMTDDLQSLIFCKMQEVVDSGFLDVPPGDLVPLVIKAVLNMPPSLLQLLQGFDFTKDIPKIVIVSSGKQTFAVFECILLVFFNLIGFDIIIYTPTGYKNLESYIKPEAYESFTLGDFKYDFVAQNLKPPKEIPQEKTSFFNRIFKGKK